MVGLDIHLNRDVALDAVVDIFPNHIIANRKGNMVGGDFLRCVPMPSGGAVAVVKSIHKVAAANGFLVVGRGNEKVVCGLIGEIVYTGEPSFAQIVWLAFEAHAEVVDTIRNGVRIWTPPFHAAPSLAEGGAAIAHIEGDTLACRYRFIESDGQKVAFLTETFHTVEIGGHIGDSEALQLQHNGIYVRCCGEIDEGFALQRAVGEVEIPNVDFIVRYVNAFAGNLGLGEVRIYLFNIGLVMIASV